MVLAAPARPEADFRVTLEHLQTIFELMRPSFDHILVDLGSRLDPRTLWLIEQADAHVFVLFPEIAALRAMSLFMAFLADTTPLRAKTHLVVNHVFPKELLKTRDVENLLRAKPAAEIPYTEVEMIRSVNEGVPLVIGRPGTRRRRAAPRRAGRHRDRALRLRSQARAQASLRSSLIIALGVPEEGFEPPRLAAAGFKPAASAIPPLRQPMAPIA